MENHYYIVIVISLHIISYVLKWVWERENHIEENVC